MNIAVTGGSGRLGRSLVPYLIEQGHQVVSIDRALPQDMPPPPAPRPRFQIADTRNFGELVACLRGCDAVVHLAAHAHPGLHPDSVVYSDNTVGSYNALSAAATLGINRVCLASSINAIGGAYSRAGHYDYFPVDEQHPTYAEDPYALSKWVLEQQGDMFARRYEQMRIASLRFHGLVDSAERMRQFAPTYHEMAIRHLWGYTLMAEACRACLLALTADFSGHEAFYIVAPQAIASEDSLDLARQYYPDTAVRGDMPGHQGFFDCAKAERLLGWRHAE